MFYAAVDGGGSTCRVRVRDDAGRLLGEAVGAAANVYLDFPQAVATIGATLDQAFRTSGLLSGDRQVRLGLGLAGVSGPQVAEAVRAALVRFGAATVTHDGVTACIGAHAGADGGLIIAGTGSAAVACVGGITTTLGGRGFILGDDGSGARLGLSALRLSLRAHDGLAPATPLTRALMGRFADDPVAAIDWGRQARSADFGTLAPAVIEAATDGDAAGLLLVAEAAEALAGLGDALARLGAPRLCLVGGLAAPLVPFLPERLAAALSPPRRDALDGALLMVGCPLDPGPASPP